MLALEAVGERERLSSFLLGDNLLRNLPKADFFGEVELGFSSNTVIGEEEEEEEEEEEAASYVVFMMKPGLIEGSLLNQRTLSWVYTRT